MAALKRVLLTLDALDMSGVAFSALNFVAGLLRRNVQVMVLSRAGGEREPDFRERSIQVGVSRYFGLPLIGSGALVAVQTFKPEIIHAQSTVVGERSRRIAGLLEVPVVVTANRLEDGEDRLLAAHEDIAVIAVSEAIRERLTNRGGVQRDRIRVIPNGLDLTHFPGRNLEAIAEQTHLPVVGTYGTLMERKGQRVFVAAAAAVLKTGTDAEFLIIGQGPDKPVLRALAQELGIANRITFAPGTTTDIRSMHNLDIFVEPTREEGLGLSVLQAMAAGIPVVASGVGGIFSLVEDGKTGVLVASGDAAAMAAAICELLADPERRLELAQKARYRVEQEFEAGRVAQEALDFYRELREEKAASNPHV